MRETRILRHRSTEVLERVREQITLVVRQRMPRDEYRRQRRALDSIVVVRINAHLVPFRRERVLAMVERSQLVVRLQLRPTPQPAVNDVRKSLTVCLLKVRANFRRRFNPGTDC